MNSTIKTDTANTAITTDKHGRFWFRFHGNNQRWHRLSVIPLPAAAPQAVADPRHISSRIMRLAATAVVASVLVSVAIAAMG